MRYWRRCPIAKRQSPDRTRLGHSAAATLAFVTIVCLVPGCAYLEKEFGAPLPLDEFKYVEAGSNYAQVLNEFGPPTRMSALTDGMVFQYEYVKLNERQYGLILPGAIGKWIKAVYASADAAIEVMQFVFDDGGSLRGSGAAAWNADAGGGFSVTLIFSVGSLTDTELYEQFAQRELAWGMALTQPPLQTLNVRQNLSTGANGVQLVGTTTAVGQHTLELQN